MPRPPTGSLSRRSGAGMLSLALAAAMAACGGPAPNGIDYGESSEALTGSDAVSRAQQWVNAQVPYCQSPNDQPDPDHACAPVCMRMMNAMWDPYRSDCSGFVSWAWGLPAPGRTTSEFAPAVTDITQAIDGHSLEPGDALNIPADHMILFVSWDTPGQSATFMEEPGCSSAVMYAHEFTSNVEINGSSVTVDYEGGTFTAIRYMGLTGQGDGGTVPAPDAGSGSTGGGTSCYVSSLNQSGTCQLTSDCASAGGTSTPGYCPGAADIQCCTMAMPTMSSSGCTSNAQCPGSAPVCDTSTGQCHGCRSNSDCSHGVCATAVNDPRAGECVPCTANINCPATGICDTSTDTCVQCLTDAQCPLTAPLCARSTCHACQRDAECSGNPHGEVCQTTGASAGVCVQCARGDASACRGATPICDYSLGTCVACASDSDCPASTPACDAVTHRCECKLSDPRCHRMTADAGTTTMTAPASTSGSGGDQPPATGGCATGSTDLAVLGLLLALVIWRRRALRSER